jgi:hypothetical protein
LSKHIHKTTMVATAFLLMLQTIAPTWALSCLHNPTDAPCAQSTHGMNVLEDCVCTMQLAVVVPTCCAAPEEPATDTTSFRTVSSNTCDCYVQHSEPLLPPSQVFSELSPTSIVCGFIQHSANHQDVVAAKRSQVITPVAAIRVSRYAQIVLSVWLT